MSDNSQVLANWDWDKLQEKRSKQQGHVPPPKDEEPFDERDDNFRERGQSPLGKIKDFLLNARGGSGGGGGGNDDDDGGRRGFASFPAGKGVLLGVLAILLLWLGSGIYIVQPDEQGIVLTFGKYSRTTEPGPHYAFPVPIESVYKPPVTRILRSEIGYRSVGQSAKFQQGHVRSMPQEASMLTGDENVVNVQFSVQYKIKNAKDFLFNVDGPQDLVRNAAEAAMREVIGNNLIDSAITDGKLKIQSDATVLLQGILDRYGAGIQVIAVQLQDVHPPQEVIEAFKDVASAREDKSRIINEAEAYRNALLPEARGRASAIRNDAEAYSATRVQNAEGAAARFDALRSQYEKAPEVTRQRLYYETMESILSASEEKVLMDGQAAQRALPYLPLPTLAKPAVPGAEVKK